MPIAIGNKRLPVTLDEKRQKKRIAATKSRSMAKVNLRLCVLR
jgi:hypothetical protein